MVVSMTITACQQRPVIVASYESLGISLKTVGKSAKTLCEEGQLKPEVCGQIKKIYNTARDAYIAAGDVYKKVIETGVDEDIKNYKADIDVVITALREIQDLVVKNVGGGEDNGGDNEGGNK